MSNTKYYKCPDGTTVRSLKKYVKEWHDVIDPFEKEFGMICTGFDPTISFRTEDWSTSIQLPVHLVIKWNKKIKDLNTSIQSLIEL